jgi:uncharacterized iron-regulated membrane protein
MLYDPGMTFRQRALRQPQNLWIRKAVFQIHLWTGLAVGLYIVVISVSGSAVVFRRELMRSLANRPQISAHDASTYRLSEDELGAAAQRAYPDYRVTKVWRGRNGERAVDIWMERGKAEKKRLFDPYTGADLGETIPRGVQVLDWLVRLHDDLLGGFTGRTVNGVGAITLVVLCVTGAIIWWPGSKTWRRSLSVKWTAGWKRMNWDLHSAIGFWTFAFVFMWALSGIYLVFPRPFSAVVDFLDPLDPQSFAPRAGDVALEWLAKLHFGRFAGIKTKALWTVMGLVPPALFVTGALMWWNRVLRPIATRRAANVRLATAAEDSAVLRSDSRRGNATDVTVVSDVTVVTATETGERVLQ